MLAYIPYMDPMGMDGWTVRSDRKNSHFFFRGKWLFQLFHPFFCGDFKYDGAFQVHFGSEPFLFLAWMFFPGWAVALWTLEASHCVFLKMRVFSGTPSIASTTHTT